MLDRAHTVVVGCGIVGASAAYHLAELGQPDLLVLDQGPLFETGGSSSHAPGLVFQTNRSRSTCRVAQDTVALYASLGEPCWYGVGSLEVATTPERMWELRRRLGWSRSWGIEGGELLTPAEAAEQLPLLDPGTILGAYRVPSDGVAKAVRVVEVLAGRAAGRGVVFQGGVAVTGFETGGGRVRAVLTDHGRVECERVLLCAGIWGPAVGALAGVPVPLVAVQHQLVWTDPVAALAGETREVVHPILRHQDMAMYFRQRADHYAVGSYKHEPIATPQQRLRGPGGPLPPAVMPFTPEDFGAAEAEAVRLLPALAGRTRPSDPERSLNGMFSFTPDGGSIVGESAAVRGVWVCEAVWITHAGGMGRQVAEWMALGEPGYDLAEADANRFYPFQTTAPYVLERGKQQYREVYDVLHPRQQPSRPRNLRLTPFHPRHAALGASFVVGAGWERPQWLEANRPLLPGAPWEKRDGWAARLWSPVEGAEHLATRSDAALYDLTPFAKFEVSGPDAEPFLERVCANRVARAPGAVVYTAMLTPRGGIRCDLTVTREDQERFRVVTGGVSGRHDLAWLRAQVRQVERVAIAERTGEAFVLGLWGPKARAILQSVTDADLSNESFPYLTARYLDVGEVPVWAQRISYVGELGWELYGEFAMGGRVWELLWQAGREHGLIAAGLGAFDTLRLEKGYRLWGQDIHTEYDPLSAGIGFAVRWAKQFQGRAALEALRERGVRRRLVPMLLDDPAAVVLGLEPIRCDGAVVGYVTSAGYGYSIGRCIAYGYLPVELAGEGTKVAVEYFDECQPATVATEPLVDPEGERLKG